jgi:glycerol uptake facilitator-like aquaporin
MVMVEEDNRPWAGLDIQVHPNLVAMFSLRLLLLWVMDTGHSSGVINGCMGNPLTDLAPSLCRYVPNKILNQRTVHTKLMDNS